MGKSGKLKAALEAHKGVDHKLERQKKLAKQADKRKQNKSEWKRQLEEEEQQPVIDIAEIDDTDSSEDENEEAQSDMEIDEAIPETNGVSLDQQDKTHENEDQEEEEEEEEEDIPYSDIESLNSEERGDAVPYQRLTINNHAALIASLQRIALPLSTMPFSHHQSITSDTPTTIPDIDDDLNRELAFYAQALSAVKIARKELKKEGVPFGRPADFFAEMVKSEEHMGRVRQRLVDDAAQKKASSEARRQRDLKKFGKAVQVAKLQERDKAKRETMDKINIMKRKRSNTLPTADKEEDMFDIALEQETKRPRTASASKGSKGSFSKDDKPNGKANFKRQQKDHKYGFGGKKRFAKSGDAQSSSDMRDFSVRKMKGKTGGGGGGGGAKKRPGKARRASARS